MAAVKKVVKKVEADIESTQDVVKKDVSEKELHEVRKYFHEFFDINLSVEQGLLFLETFTKKD